MDLEALRYQVAQMQQQQEAERKEWRAMEEEHQRREQAMLNKIEWTQSQLTHVLRHGIFTQKMRGHQNIPSQYHRTDYSYENKREQREEVYEERGHCPLKNPRLRRVRSKSSDAPRSRRTRESHSRSRSVHSIKYPHHSFSEEMYWKKEDRARHLPTPYPATARYAFQSSAMDEHGMEESCSIERDENHGSISSLGSDSNDTVRNFQLSVGLQPPREENRRHGREYTRQTMDYSQPDSYAKLHRPTEHYLNEQERDAWRPSHHGHYDPYTYTRHNMPTCQYPPRPQSYYSHYKYPPPQPSPPPPQTRPNYYYQHPPSQPAKDAYFYMYPYSHAPDDYSTQAEQRPPTKPRPPSSHWPFVPPMYTAHHYSPEKKDKPNGKTYPPEAMYPRFSMPRPEQRKRTFMN
ncbi:hypothetical protein BDF14DRAFT_1817771 [Spinellus fusiger]|nr:hypothetical protein BDF14DRAFT_1817771 [Spinellus fusiger]